MSGYIEWTGTVQLPAGPWVNTHEFVGEIRPFKKDEWYLVNGCAMKATYDKIGCEFPILRPKKPTWEPPAHLVGTGVILRRTVSGYYRIQHGTIELYLSTKEGLLTAHAKFVGITTLPELQPGEEIVL